MAWKPYDPWVVALREDWEAEKRREEKRKAEADEADHRAKDDASQEPPKD